MKSVTDYYDCLDHRTVNTILLRNKRRKDFVIELGPEELFDRFHKSKVGYIKVHKVSDNPGIEKNKVYEGITAAFGEGFAVWISGPSTWFHTSVIKNIDWDKHTFNTLNSTYAFDFEELSYTDLLKEFSDKEINSALRKF